MTAPLDRGRSVDLVTNYRSRYGYSPADALRAEFWWRLEHIRWPGLLRRYAYGKRKATERQARITMATRTGSESLPFV